MVDHQKKEIIKNYLLDEEVSLEERKRRFEIAWDIRHYFGKILEEFALEKVLLPLKEKLEKEGSLPPSFEVSYFDFGSIYITKPSWKEKPEDRGIISIALERWFLDSTTVGLVKNRDFSLRGEELIRNILVKEGLLIKHNKSWLSYLMNLPEIFSLPVLDYYKYILENPDRIVEDYFEALNRILKVVEKKEVQDLLDRLVEERKMQISGKT